MNFSDGPIITCSTGTETPSAIAVLRITGFKDISLFQSVLSLKLKKIKSRYAYFCQIINDDHVLDDIVLIFFAAPNSYTGENILELHVHGNPLHVSRLITLFLTKFGLREAFAGEFTFRAYRNQKLSLSQIEGLDMLLHAKTPLALDQGVQLLNGNLHKLYYRLYELVLDLKTSIELLIDFSEDVGEDFVRQRYFKALKEFLELTESLYSRVGHFGDSLLNPVIVVVGPVNAGKSTLFNLMLGHKRSIVSDIQGTTRDYISEGFVCNDVHFRLVDTAGIRDTSDLIEKEGISLGLELFDTAFFRIGVLDARDFINFGIPEDVPRHLDLIVLSHADFIKPQEIVKAGDCPIVFANLTSNSARFLAPIGPVFESAPIGPDLDFAPIGPANSSAPIGADALIKGLIFNKYKQLAASQPLLLKRHQASIQLLRDTINSIGKEINSLDDLGIVSANIQNISACLSDLVGIVPPDELLDSIFSQFCIGK